jgi:hypothetical protein
LNIQEGNSYIGALELAEAMCAAAILIFRKNAISDLSKLPSCCISVWARHSLGRGNKDAEDDRGVLTGSKEADSWVKHCQDIFADALRTWHAHNLGSWADFIIALATAEKTQLATLCERESSHRCFETGGKKMLNGILSTFSPALRGLKQLTTVKGEPFSIRRWIREGNLWIPYRSTQVDAMRSLASCWMRLAVFETLSLLDDDSRRIWFHVDELAAIHEAAPSRSASLVHAMSDRPMPGPTAASMNSCPGLGNRMPLKPRPQHGSSKTSS